MNQCSPCKSGGNPPGRMRRAARGIRTLGQGTRSRRAGDARPDLHMERKRLGTFPQPRSGTRGVLHLGRRRPGAGRKMTHGCKRLPTPSNNKTDPHSDVRSVFSCLFCLVCLVCCVNCLVFQPPVFSLFQNVQRQAERKDKNKKPRIP